LNTISAFSPAKINLFLHITGRRADGYHLLQSVFCPITLADRVTLTFSRLTGNNLEVCRTGDLGHIPEERDLTIRACRAFYAETTLLEKRQLCINVKKRIPEQAGLGGGSSNAATVLRLLQHHHGNPIPTSRLLEIGLLLGADVPFFLQDDSAFIEGIGELITPLPSVSGHLLIYKPSISCSTAAIFNDPQLTCHSSSVKIALFGSSRRINSELFAFIQARTENALQTVVSRQFPDWEKQFQTFSGGVKKFNPQLIRMSGSGSAMFAVFASPSQCSKAAEEVSGLSELQEGQWFECQIKPNNIVSPYDMSKTNT
jgi:4-diphosphocytidyl-2-C-methyl-D-erythritol kinase